MFTGIIMDIGTVESVERKAGGKSFAILTGFSADSYNIGSSICCSGACLTVTKKSAQGSGSSFSVDVSNETLACTSLGSWDKGRKINLELSLKMGDELGGHMVSGHVDDVAEVRRIEPDGENHKFTFLASADKLQHFIAEKGSVTLDGVSLTVNEVDDHSFSVNIIPHTFANTTFKNLKKGDKVNMEIDMLARYTARLLGAE